MPKGLIFDLKRFAVHDGPGIRLTVFFKGCPLNCWWCHNPEGISSNIESSTKENRVGKKVIGRNEEKVGWLISVKELMEEIEKEVLFFDESGGGVTFSGGEPLDQIDFLVAMLKKCQEQMIHTVLDTSGFASKETLKQVLEYVNIYNFDLKLIDEKQHRAYTGVSSKLILSNLRLIHENNKHIRIRFPIIPGITDKKENINKLKEVLCGLPNIREIDLLPFHAIAESKYRRFQKQNKLSHLSSVSGDELIPLKTEFENMGLSVSIGG